MSTLPPLRSFHLTSDRPFGSPSTEHPLTNPMKMLLCRYPLGYNVENPNLMLIHSRRNPCDEYLDPLFAAFTAGSSEPPMPTNDPLRKTFWMKTYSENEGILEQLEAQNILRRTGQVKKQGYVTLIAVETVLNKRQWAEVCSGCGRREQLGASCAAKYRIPHSSPH
ncbi:hypothetical protein B0O99DRAFT_695923 [Bisporella sp. PMI_857]|nr:hypothetical protein B0O99DRAFT_695923 [Bisporella sp. PMI_857]